MINRSSIHKTSSDKLFPSPYLTKKSYHMKSMRRFLLTFVSLVIASTGIMAQNTFTAHPGSKGIFIICGDQLPLSFKYRISRREVGQKEWQVLKTLAFPQNKEAWEGRIFSETLNNLTVTLPDSATTDMLWKSLKRSSVTDSLYSWKSYPFMLSACGTGWWDSSADAREKYDYKIEKDEKGKLDILKTIEAVSSVPVIPEYNIEPDSIAGNGISVMLDYNLLSFSNLAGFRVYRSYYLRNDFRQIHPLRMYRSVNGEQHLIIADESVVDKAQYSYYLIPFDYYGNDGKSTDTVNVYNSSSGTIPSLVTRLRAVSQEKGKDVRLSWQLDNNEDIVSIDIFKALVYDGYYTRIASVTPGDTVFIDRNVLPVTSYYYTLVLNTAYGRTYPSARIPVINKAGKTNDFPPSDLKAIRNGNTVSLSWDRVGKDIHGYYLYRSGSFTGQMEVLTGIIINSDSIVTYVDSLINVPDSPILIYAVASVNSSGSISPLSSRMSVTNMPASMPVPTGLRAIATDKSIQLFWDDLRGTYPFVTGYRISRREANKRGEAETQKFSLNMNPTGYGINSFVDTTSIEGIHYYYSIEAIGPDSLDISSPGLEAGAIIPENLPLPPGQLRAMNSKGGILLQWTNPLDPSVKKILIMREEKGELPGIIKELDISSQEWLDESVADDTVYYYTILTVDGKGRHSMSTEPLGIRSAASHK